METPAGTLKASAIRLRKRGLSYGEIKAKIGVSKGTLSYWLKGIPLKEKDRIRLYTKRIQLLSLGHPSQKARREREIEKIISEAKDEILTPISLESFKLMGAALYWAEGRKRKGGVEITNSDPYLILFSVKWIEKVFNVSPSLLKARLNIYPQQNELYIKSFWSDLTGIPINRFGKTYVKPLSTGYKKNNLYYGTIQVTVPKSTDNKHRIFGWIKMCLSEIDNDVQIAMNKWDRLKETERPVNLISRK